MTTTTTPPTNSAPPAALPKIPDVSADRSAAQIILETVESTAIATQADRDNVFAAMSSARSIEKAIEEKFKPPKQALDSVKRWILDAEKAALALPLKVRDLATRKLREYDDEQERIRQKREAEAREAARKAEEDRRLAEAAEVQRTDGEEAAMQVLAEPIPTPVVVVEDTNERAAGEGRTMRWKARILDATKVPREWCIPDEKAIQAHARATKGRVPIAGVEFYSERDYSVRSR